MKRIIFGFLCILFGCCLSSCDFKLQDSGETFLTVESFMITESQYDSLCNKYSIKSNKDYILFDNYDDFIKLYGQYSDENIDATYEKEQQEVFKKHKKFCYVREDEMKTYKKFGYSYSGKENIIHRWDNSSQLDANNEIAYFIDFVDVPNNIYKKLNK